MISLVLRSACPGTAAHIYDENSEDVSIRGELTGKQGTRSWEASRRSWVSFGASRKSASRQLQGR